MEDRVTIIGAGIVGICCALSLQDRGIAVRLIDRGEPGQETSFGNAGIISPWSIVPQAVPGIWKSVPAMLLRRDAPLSVRPAFWPKMITWGLRFLGNSGETAMRGTSDAMQLLCAPSIDLYRKHLAGTGHEGLILDSYYVHAFRKADRPTLKSIDYKIRIEKGADLELIGASELARLEPALSSSFKAAVLIKDQARAASPGKIGKVLAQKAMQQGAEFVQAELRSLRRTDDNRWQLDMANQSLTTERIVMAAGVWSADLLKPLGLSMPLVAERGYHVEFSGSAVHLTHSIMDVDAKIVASSMIDGLRVAGSSEFADIDAPPDPRKMKLLTKQACAMLPDLDPAGVETWMGRRPSFPDSLPSLGSVKGHSGLFAAFGHSHYGLMMAPKTGELLADILAGNHPNMPLDAFAPERFG